MPEPTYRGLPAGLVAALHARYDEPHRHYHDRRHLDAVLDHVDELVGLAGDAEAVRLAAWFHDAVYDPGRTDNEQASADLARALLAAHGAAGPLVAEVTRLVLLTATHDPEETDTNGAVLCDADLAVLGGDPAEYQNYTDRVRQEYAALDDATFAAGRAQVLRTLLSRSRLFRTCAGQERWETAARQNLAGELAALTGTVSGQ